MDPIYQQLGVAGIVIAVLVAGMKWMASRYIAMESKLDKASEACVARESALTTRIQSLEDARSNDLIKIVTSTTDALKEAAAALRINARAFEKATEESGQFRIRRDPQP